MSYVSVREAARIADTTLTRIYRAIRLGHLRTVPNPNIGSKAASLRYEDVIAWSMDNPAAVGRPRKVKT